MIELVFKKDHYSELLTGQTGSNAQQDFCHTDFFPSTRKRPSKKY